MKEFEEILRDAEELEALWKRVSQTGVPKTIQEAESTGWDILGEISSLGIPLPFNIGYDADERRHDRQRIIRLPDALQIIEAFEERLIDVTTQGPKQIFLNKLKRLSGLLNVATTFVSLIVTLVYNTINGKDVLDLLIYFASFGIFGDDDLLKKAELISEHIHQVIRRYAALILGYGLLTLNLPTFSAHLQGVVSTREEHVQLLRKAALPQRRVKRHWRRKVSRL